MCGWRSSLATGDSCRVGKIVRGTVAAWARRVHDFAHASHRATHLCPPYATTCSNAQKSASCRAVSENAAIFVGQLPPPPRRQSVVLTFRPAILDRHVLTFGEPALPEALMECCQRIGGLASLGERPLRKPITGIADCARAASGHAAALPSRVMNWRRLGSRMGSSPEPAVPAYSRLRMPRKRPAGPWGRPESF